MTHRWSWSVGVWGGSLTLLVLVGAGRVYGLVSAPSVQGKGSSHCLSLKRWSTGTTWPSVVKMYLLSDLCRGLSSSNSCSGKKTRNKTNTSSGNAFHHINFDQTSSKIPPQKITFLLSSASTMYWVEPIRRTRATAQHNNI